MRSALFFLAFSLAVSSSAAPARGQQSSDAGLGSILGGQQTGTQSGSQSGTQYGTQSDGQSAGELLDPFGQQQFGNVQSQVPGGTLHNPQDQEALPPDGRDSAAAALRELNQLPPDPPTEFQRFVQSSTGRMLPLYGSQLFRNAPSTFAPIDRAPVPLDYVIGPGDELRIQVWGQVTLNSRFVVDRAGDIYIPKVGTVRVAGLPFAQLQSYLKSQMGRVFRNFDLNVNMGQLRSIQIFLVGQARRPGSYTVSSLSTLVDALFATGGPTPQGSLRHIQLKRAGQVVVDLDLYDLLQHGDKSKDAPLLPGDVIYIPPAGPQVAVTGSVNTPAIYELKAETGELKPETAELRPETTVADALALASGPTNIASETRARVEHVDAHRMRSVTDLALDPAGLAAVLKNGDILELSAIIDRFRNGVTLRGNVANPGHYAWRPGMRVGDLFPDRDALITRDYWLRRGRLGQPVLTYTPSCPSVATPAAGQATDGSGILCIPQQGSPTRASQAARAAGNAGANSDTPAQTQGSAAGTSQPTGTGTTDPAINGAGTGAASTGSAEVGRMAGEFQPRYDVKLSAPEIDWSYAVIERQDPNTLTTSLLPFNLGRLVLDGDSSQNLELRPGDVVTIFSKADIQVPQTQQTRFVRLEGEFVSSGIYSVMPGETLDHLVARAGGLTPEAYLYGSEFTRESTRRVQQQRLNEYIDQISLQSGVNAANTAARTISPIDAAAGAAAQVQNQNIIATLRQARASGRIVLNLPPDAQTAAQLPTVSLENGDAFIVPHRPSTVSVSGAVYNPNAFLFEPGHRVGYYLSLAGGPDRNADRKRAYVVRADGQVISKQQISSLRKNAFDSLHIYPGDTIIVPLNISSGAALRNVVDIAQIFGQFGVALAAASVIF